VGILDNFEKGLERVVNGAFAKTFKSGLQPLEVTAALRRELDTKAAVVSRDRILVPNDFVVRLSAGDYQRMTDLGPALIDEFTQLVQQHAAAQHYAFAGGISIRLERDDSLSEGLVRVDSVNVKGVYNCLRAGVLAMKDRGGVILNIASVASTVGVPDRFAYSMSKGAVLTMTLSVACDYVGQGIRCNAISPGRVHTPFVNGFLSKSYPGREKEMFDKLSRTQPIGRMGRPSEIAELALFLCSDSAAFITGSNYAIDGGFVSLKV